MTEQTSIENALDGAEEQKASPVAEAASAESEQPEQENAAAAEAEPVESETAPKGRLNEDGGITVPIKALHEERDARQELRREVEQLKTMLSQAPAEPVEVPDPIDDPEGYAQFNRQQMQDMLTNERLNLSENYAVRTHGADAVEAAKSWFATQNQNAKNEILSQPDPYEYAIQEQKRQSLTEQLSADPDKLDRVLRLLEGEDEPKVKAPPPPISTVTAQSASQREPMAPSSVSLESLFND